VRLHASIPDKEQAAHRSSPLRWVNFAEVHQILCPQGPEAASVMASLPQRLSQTSWKPTLGSEARSVDVANTLHCRALLTESKHDIDNRLQVTLTYTINPS